MDKNAALRLDVEAAKVLIRWKSLFADEVAMQARRLASDAGQERVTLLHYRQAAQIAIHSLSAAILDEGTSGEGQKAA